MSRMASMAKESAGLSLRNQSIQPKKRFMRNGMGRRTHLRMTIKRLLLISLVGVIPGIFAAAEANPDLPTLARRL
jgi:hypothetical protein